MLKTSQIKEALEALNIDIHVQLNYNVSRAVETGIIIFQCLYWLPNANVPYSRFYINIGTVNNDEKALATNLLTTTALVQFTEWVKFIASLPANSTLAKHDSYFRVQFKAGAISITSNVAMPQ